MSYETLRLRAKRFPPIPIALVSLLVGLVTTALAEEPNATRLGDFYQANIRPLVQRYCTDCHGGADTVEGDINLEVLKSWDDMSKHSKVWQKVAEMLGNGLMPPQDAEQPTEAERAKLQKWVADYLALAAQARAGDPGRVVLRRLSNAEYTYTLRDLTGVDSLDPAREFPADGAAGEGFTNTGNALVMSPELVTKYLDAAKEVASHAVLLPDGFRFSPHTTGRDWTDDKLAEIRNFYSQFTDAGGGSQVNLQGIVFDTNQGGRLPSKSISPRRSSNASTRSRRKTIEAVAREHGLNAKYLGILWASLQCNRAVAPAGRSSRRWRKAKPEDGRGLAADIAAWQKSLWSFASVGLIGRDGRTDKVDGARQPAGNASRIFKFKIPESPDGEDVTISLVATDAGDGNESDFVVWQAPRLVRRASPICCFAMCRDVARELKARRERLFANAAAYLNAADEIASADGDGRCRTRSRQEYGCDEDELAGVARLIWASAPGMRLDRKVCSRTNLTNVGGLRIHQWLGKQRYAAARGELFERTRADSGKHEAARRGGASVADVAGGRRLAQSDRRDRAYRRIGYARPSGMRQRGDVVARTAAWFNAATTGQRHGARGQPR